MSDIILKDYNGNEQTYEGVEKVKFNTSDGGTQLFSKGDTAEGVLIDLDFTDGDQAIDAPEGCLVKSAIIRKPEDLKEDYILKGITIAGIDGAYEGGVITIDIFPSQPVSGFDELTSDDYRASLPSSININADKLYYVDWDGKTYACKGVATSNPSGDYNYVILGNGSLFGVQGDNDAPFMIMRTIETDSALVVAYDDTKDSHDIHIYQSVGITIETESLTITENGTYTAPEGKAYSPIIVDVPSSCVTETDIFPLQPVSGFQEDTELLLGSYFAYVPTFEIKEDETYYVEWEGETYTCKGMAVSFNGINAVYLGNGSMLGYPHNNEPFAVVYLVDAGLTEFITFADGSYNVRVYQTASGAADIEIKPLTVTENGTYTAPDGEAYSPVVVNVPSSGTLPLGYQLKEIVPETTLTFAVGNSSLIPNTPAVVLADGTAVTNMDVINNGESGLVVWDGKLYAVYAGSRRTSMVQLGVNTTNFSMAGAIGNIGIPSKWSLYGVICSVVEDTKSCGISNEPFLIIANSSNGFVVAIPEDSTNLTHTIQIFKFVK